MQTECSTTLFEFAPVEDRKVMADFGGGAMTSNAGALLLGGVDKAVKLVERAAGCFIDLTRPRVYRTFCRHAGGATAIRSGAGL